MTFTELMFYCFIACGTIWLLASFATAIFISSPEARREMGVRLPGDDDTP